MSLRCVPVPENDTCRNITESYGIDVAQVELNTAIVNAMESARSALTLESNIDPTCITITDLIICVFKLPPCIGTKLILPCIESCEKLLGYFLTCYDATRKHLEDQTVKDHFKTYGCRLPESYYDGYDSRHFITYKTQSSQCIDIDIPNG